MGCGVSGLICGKEYGVVSARRVLHQKECILKDAFRICVGYGDVDASSLGAVDLDGYDCTWDRDIVELEDPTRD